MQNIPIEQIAPNPLQPRERIDPEALKELANSIREQGILQPILVRPDGQQHQILVGERRWRASQLAGLKTVPAIVHDIDDRTAQEWALLENIQREDLNPIEEARAYQTLIAEHGLTQVEVAERVGKDRASVANAVRLLNLSQSYLDDLIEGELTAGHARVLLSLTNANQRKKLRNLIVEKGFSVRETERHAHELQNSEASQKKKTRRLKADEPVIDANLLHFRDLLEEKLKTRVTIKPQSKAKGQAIIHYASLNDLDRLLEALGLSEEAPE